MMDLRYTRRWLAPAILGLFFCAAAAVAYSFGTYSYAGRWRVWFVGMDALLGITSLGIARREYLAARAEYFAQRGTCRECGHSLDDPSADRCDECGASTTQRPSLFARQKPSNLRCVVYALFALAAGSVLAGIAVSLPPGEPVRWPYIALGCTIGGTGLFALAIPVVREWHSIVRRNRGHEGLCPNCGYDLRGNTSGRCPECGSAAQPRSVDDDKFRA